MESIFQKEKLEAQSARTS